MSAFTITIPSDIYRALVIHARTDYPHETCGLLRGRDGCVLEVLPARNVAIDPRRDYEVDASTLLQALRWEDKGDELIAIYHSHPSSPAYPSAVDAANAFYPDSITLILSLQNRDEPHLNGYFLRSEMQFTGMVAEKLQRDIHFDEVRPGLWARLFAAETSSPSGLQHPVPADVAFYLLFEENSQRQPPPIRMISVHPVALTIEF